MKNITTHLNMQLVYYQQIGPSGVNLISIEAQEITRKQNSQEAAVLQCPTQCSSPIQWKTSEKLSSGGENWRQRRRRKVCWERRQPRARGS